jgi:hypothetical protein
LILKALDDNAIVATAADSRSMVLEERKVTVILNAPFVLLSVVTKKH